LSFAGLLSFFHVAEYLLFRNPADLLHYNYCTKSFSSFHLAREALSDRLVFISLAFTTLVKMVAYIIIFIDRKVKNEAGSFFTISFRTSTYKSAVLKRHVQSWVKGYKFLVAGQIQIDQQ
jgi:hypothetical protein